MTAGGAYTLKHDTISKLPFPSARGDQQQPVIALVDRILVAKKANPSADTSSLEAEIDQLVYQLYGLTQEEIAIVEASSKKSISPSPATSSAQPSDVPAEDDDSDDARD